MYPAAFSLAGDASAIDRRSPRMHNAHYMQSQLARARRAPFAGSEYGRSRKLLLFTLHDLEIDLFRDKRQLDVTEEYPSADHMSAMFR